MLYLITTSSDRFAFETLEDMSAFLNLAILPDYAVEQVEATDLYTAIEQNTRYMLRGLLF